MLPISDAKSIAFTLDTVWLAGGSTKVGVSGVKLDKY
jgi:hypothetical protein